MNREAKGRRLAPPSSLPDGRPSRTGRNSLRATRTKEGAADLNTTTGVFSTKGRTCSRPIPRVRLMLSRDPSTSRAFCNTGSSFAIRITVPTGRFQIDYKHQKPRTAKRRSGVLRFYKFNLVSKCLAQMKLRFLLYLLYRLTANSPRYQTKYRCFLPRSALSMSSDHHQTGLSMSNRS